MYPLIFLRKRWVKKTTAFIVHNKLTLILTAPHQIPHMPVLKLYKFHRSQQPPTMKLGQ